MEKEVGIWSVSFLSSKFRPLFKTYSTLSLYDRLYYLLLEFWCIAFVWYSFRHSKAPHLLFSIPYCLTNGVLFSLYDSF